MNHVRENLRKHIETLCLGFGSRHCGSQGERQTAEYIERYFSDLGLEVISEEYPARGWEFESFELYNVTKDRPVSGATACFYSGSVDMEDTLLVLSYDALKNLEEQPVAGRICFVTHNSPNMYCHQLSEVLESMGAAAVIFAGTKMGPAADTKFTRSPYISRIATASVNMDGAYDIMRNAGDTYRLHICARSYDARSRNVIARIGSGDRKAVIGGHYDTAPLIQGANDNASGTAMVLELARLMRDVELHMTLDFVAFSAEEYCENAGPVGSTAYVNLHAEENIRWFLNCDGCADYFTDTQLALGHREKLPELTCRYRSIDKTNGGDNGPFCNAGIPAVWLGNGPRFGMLHTAEDSVDKLDYDLVADTFFQTYDLLLQLLKAEEL